MAMTKRERNTITNLVKRLKEERLGAGEGYCEFTDPKRSKIYLDSWIIGPMEALLAGDTKLAESMSGR